MKAYLVLDFSVTNMEPFMEYVEKIPHQIKRHLGKYIVRGEVPTVVEGDWSPQRVVILEFPTKQNAEQFLADPDSQQLFKIRHQNTISKLILLGGC